MRWKWILFLCIGIGATGCNRAMDTAAAPEALPRVQSSSGQIAQIHFIGSANAGKDTNAVFLKGVWAMPETQALMKQTLTRLARAPFELAKRRGVASTNDFVSLMRPLLDDLVSAESWTELRGETNQPTEFALAVQLAPARADLWRTNLSTILMAWTGLSVTTNADGSGWELKKHLPPNLIRFEQSGNWVVLSAGEDKIPLADELVARIKTDGRPCPAASNYVLRAEGDLTRLAGLVPLPEEVQALQLSSVSAQWKIDDDGVQTHIVASRDRPFDLNLEQWRIPTNLVHQPLVGFTAAQGIGDWLAGHFPRLKLSPMPEQYFVWTMQGIPYQTYVATPVENASNTLAQLAPQLFALNTNRTAGMGGTMDWSPKPSKLTWSGLPFIEPFIEGSHGGNGDFLLSGVFPNPVRRSTLPQAMLEEISGRTNLAYYGWEVTAERMDSWRNLSQLYLLFGNFRQFDGTSASGHWLDAVTGRLGNEVTEVFLTRPNELTLERKSPIGFTAFELLVLANWFETPNFPFDKPIVSVRAGKGSPRRPGKAAPAMPGMPGMP